MSLKDLSLGDSEDQILKAACTGKQDLSTSSDRISNLPDDILIRIISSLTLKQAGCTSVLSKRWTHVWAYAPRLNFDASEIVHDIKHKPKIREEAKYLRWVDQVLSSHKAHTVDELRVKFQFQNHHHDKLDNWLRFAMEKKVKRLEFDIMPLGRRSPLIPHTLPTSLPPWTPLTSLEFTHVDLTGEVLQKFLSGCPNLEHLSVNWAKSLVDLEVVGALNLKSLKLTGCNELESLEISAPNLISFHYSGAHISWPLKYTPNLTELYLGTFQAANLMSDFSDLSSCMSQLEVLILFPLLNCKYLPKVYMCPQSDEVLFGLSSLIEACPLLHKFELQLEIYNEMEMTRKTTKAKVIPHHNLKILEIMNFTGGDLDM